MCAQTHIVVPDRLDQFIYDNAEKLIFYEVTNQLTA